MSEPERTRLERLREARDLLEVRMRAETDGSKLASLIREYRVLLEALAVLDTKKAGSAVDELAKRRKDRGAGAAHPDQAAVRD